MLAVPTATPVMIPVSDPAPAIVPSLLVHVPPPPSVSVVVLPTQTCDEPDIMPGNGFTETIIVLLQPVSSV